jgi:CubicO group peptidase (beta-lactamase class C family)
MNKIAVVFALTFSTALTSCTFGGKATPSPSSLSARIDTFVHERMNAGKLPGLSLVIVKDGEVRISKGYGFANLEQQTAMTDRTRIAIGSTTKSMTALAVMQLVERGKLELDAPVVTYLPWFKVDDPSSGRITLRHVLAHTSGLPTRTNFDGNRDPNVLEQHVRSLASIKLHRAPGSGFEYANDGYAVAGLVVQVVSGMPYAEYMTKFVFAPLGMTDATFDLSKAEREGMAQGYVKERSRFVPRPMMVSQGDAPAGTLLTSARDVGRYLNALLNGGQPVIGARSLKEQWRPQVKMDHGEYGLGWMNLKFGGLEVITHDGSVIVSGSTFVMVPSQRLGLAVLTNSVTDHTSEIAKGIATLLLGGEPEASRVPLERGPSAFKPDPATWHKYVGDYETQLGLVRIFIEGNKLLGTANDLRFELEAYGDNDFVLRGEVGSLEGHGASFLLEAGNWATLVLDGQPFGKRNN